MDMQEILAVARPVLPVLVIDRPEQAPALADALYQGGIPVLEVTLRTKQALEVICAIRSQLPHVLVGAGSVLDGRQVELAVEAGAQFAVSPGFTAEVAARAAVLELPWLPGVMTASEVMQARAAGYRQLKLFPAGGQRGLELLDSYAGPFADVEFCPTGGINQSNLGEFLQRANVVCCGGSWLAPRNLLAVSDWPAISQLATAATRAYRQVGT
jgi:2-dehydro-3-deoxyphosphogluconate aldolase/(4S)-4-hydroxy-2-oxoglutarate aldolase